jgi:hypothetical protein
MNLEYDSLSYEYLTLSISPLKNAFSFSTAYLYATCSFSAPQPAGLVPFASITLIRALNEYLLTLQWLLGACLGDPIAQGCFSLGATATQARKRRCPAGVIGLQVIQSIAKSGVALIKDSFVEANLEGYESNHKGCYSLNGLEFIRGNLFKILL